MKKLFILLAAMALFGCASQTDKTSITIDQKKFLLEVAKSNIKRAKGLSGRRNLASREGMVFIFDSRAQQTFWMKDTFIPLQIIFLDQCKIVDIQNMPVEQDPDQPQKKFSSPSPSDMAIELNANSINTNLIGTKIDDICDGLSAQE